jgi:hypothetical protein
MAIRGPGTSVDAVLETFNAANAPMAQPSRGQRLPEGPRGRGPSRLHGPLCGMACRRRTRPVVFLSSLWSSKRSGSSIGLKA